MSTHNLNNIFIYRMIHIDNIPHVLANGITHKNSINANPNYIPIGDTSIIDKRTNRIIPVNSQTSISESICLGDFIPFYFGYRTPMLFVIQHGYQSVNRIHPENIVYLVCNVQEIIESKLEFYFTDGHAIDMLSTCYNASLASEIPNLVDLEATKKLDWTKERDDKRKKEAEFLIKGIISSKCITGYICYNSTAKEKLETYGVAGAAIKIARSRYF